MRRLFLVLAALSAFFQLILVARDYAVPLIQTAWTARQEPAWQRAAELQEDEDFAGFIAFLRQSIPEDARVILPPNKPERPLAHIGFMQYYLFPRDIHNCGVNEIDDCILRVTGRNTYILGLPDFPPRALAHQSQRFVGYHDDYGVFVPK